MNERLDTEIRTAMREIVDAAPRAVPLDQLTARRVPAKGPRRRWPFTGVAIGVSLAAAVAGLVLLGERRDRDTPTGPSTSTSPVTTAPPVSTSATPTSAPVTTVPPPTTTAPVVSLPAGFAATSTTWISRERGFVLGTVPCGAGSCVALAGTTDGGATWHQAAAPPSLPGSSELPYRVRFADPDNGWVFGTDLYATHDGGTTWRKVAGVTGVTSLEAAGGQAYATAAWPPFPDARIAYTATTTGDDWHQLGDMPVSSAIARRGATGYVRGPDGGLFALTPSGFDVRLDPCGNGSDLAAIAVADADTVTVVCGSDSAAGSETKQINVSHDGGRTFTSVGDAPRSGIVTALAAASADTLVMAATGGASYLYRSIDGGASWQTVDEDGNQPQYVDLGFTSPERGVVVVTAPEPGLLVTTDAGASWSPVSIGS